MKTVLIVGAGWMTKPMVDYLMEKCGFTFERDVMRAGLPHVLYRLRRDD